MDTADYIVRARRVHSLLQRIAKAFPAGTFFGKQRSLIPAWENLQPNIDELRSVVEGFENSILHPPPGANHLAEWLFRVREEIRQITRRRSVHAVQAENITSLLSELVFLRRDSLASIIRGEPTPITEAKADRQSALTLATVIALAENMADEDFHAYIVEHRCELPAQPDEAKDDLAQQESGPAASQPPRVSVDIDNALVCIDGRDVPLEGSKTVVERVGALLQAMLSTPGEYISMSERGVRTRNIEQQPQKIRDLVDSQPGAGTRISRERVWRN